MNDPSAALEGKAWYRLLKVIFAVAYVLGLTVAEVYVIVVVWGDGGNVEGTLTWVPVWAVLVSAVFLGIKAAFLYVVTGEPISACIKRGLGWQVATGTIIAVVFLIPSWWRT